MDEFLTANCFRLGSGKVYTEVDFAVQDVVGNQHLQKARGRIEQKEELSCGMDPTELRQPCSKF